VSIARMAAHRGIRIVEWHRAMNAGNRVDVC
jgi:hypothetical protein